jgi:hypothetical protein
VAASGRRAVAAALVGAIACGGLGGCVSTQQKNERAKLVAARELGSRRGQRVLRVSPHVRVTDAALVRGRRASAIVVTLRNLTMRALVDVPIAVGVGRRDGRRTALNAGRDLDWFQTHVPAIEGGGHATWVFLTRRPVPAGGRAWARVGAGAVALRAGAALPRIEATVVAPREPVRRVRVRVDSRSEVPQHGLQVYALVQRDGRWVAAGKAAIRHVGTGGRATTVIALAGAAGRRPVRVHAIPTIFE